MPTEHEKVLKRLSKYGNFEKWEKILGKDIENGYVYDEEHANSLIESKWIALKRVRDDEGVKYNGSEVFIESHERIRMLLNHNIIRRIYD